MRGKNPKRPAINSDGKNLYVQNIFSTIQGEGPNAGEPSVFIRLGGCNLACKFCDTEFENFTELATDDVIKQVKKLSLSEIGDKVRNLVVITGGEPFRQSIQYLCNQLIAAGFRVQIETNGTLYREIAEEVEIVCSPKNSGKGYAKIREDLLNRINALKFIISAQDKKYGSVVDVGQSKRNIPVYVQPMDEYDDLKNRKNLELTKKLVLENGYKISLQIHKIIGVE